jgi:hypothetical protein
MRKVSTIGIVFLFFTKISIAQFYSTGSDPASARWRQINTEHFQLIFQNDFEKQAQQVAKTLEFYYAKVSHSLNHQPKKVSVILHNQTVRSNGYVSWAPKRMELYMTPSPDMYPDPWIEHLCIHELRHVVQIDKLNQGITKILSVVFGQQATGLVAGQLPLWYYEGDAVSTETAYSKYGRGRLPVFHCGMKTHLLGDEQRYSFDKMLFGSYRDYVPDHYELGYQLTAYARKTYGSEIWSNIENHVAKNSYTLLPTTFAFHRGLKKHYGISQKDLFDQTMYYLDSLWKIDGSQKSEINYFQKHQIIDYQNYLNPLHVHGDKVLALKKGKSHIPQFVLLNRVSEDVLFEPGYVMSDDFSYANNLLVWAEYKSDIRWENREFNNIRLLNIKTKTDFTIVEKSRYFSPDLSSDGSEIAVVEIDQTNKASLVILSTYTGKIIKKIDTRNGDFIARPQWTADNKKILVIETSLNGKRVAEYDLGTESWSTLFSMEYGDIQRIVPFENRIYFHSTLNGTDNIFVYDRMSREIYQLSNSRFGISDFDVDATGNNLIISEYSSRGLRIAEVPIERALWRKLTPNEFYTYELAEELTQQESDFKNENAHQLKDYQVKPYRKALHLFNFHSWVPFYYDYESSTVSSILKNPLQIQDNLYPGLMLLSQNKLSTTEAILGYAYKNNRHYVSSSIVLKGQFPVFSISANYGNEQQVQIINEDVWVPETDIGYSYKADVYVPLDFSEGKYIRGIQPRFSVEYFDNLNYNYSKNYYIKGIEYVQSDLTLYAYQRKAERDIIPSMGAILNLSLFNTPFENELFGYVFNINGIFYFPGGINKGFKIDAGYQYQNPQLYRFSSRFRFPRGIQAKSTDKMFKVYADYVFPIAYPDWNLGAILYIKRLKANLFIDYAYSTYQTVNAQRTAYIWPTDNSLSFGTEVTFDYHLLRTMFPLNTGVRLGYAPTENSMVFDLIFGIDLFNF